MWVFFFLGFLILLLIGVLVRNILLLLRSCDLFGYLVRECISSVFMMILLDNYLFRRRNLLFLMLRHLLHILDRSASVEYLFLLCVLLLLHYLSLNRRLLSPIDLVRHLSVSFVIRLLYTDYSWLVACYVAVDFVLRLPWHS